LKLSTTTRAAALSTVLAGSLALTACGAANETSSSGGGAAGASGAAALNGTLSGAGSSAQQAAMQGWIAGFGKQQRGVTVNYDPVGSGGGRQQFTAGGVDFAGSDAALNDQELQTADQRCGDPGVFELPDYVSAIAVVYNLPGVSSLQLSPETIAKVFRGEIRTWDDPAIAADNPGVQLPATAVTPVHRGDNSGTTSNFTDYLNKAASAVWTDKASGDWPKTLQGEAANGTSGVISAVKAGQGAIGYADESQARGLGVAKVKVGSSYVAPSAEAAAANVAASQKVSGRGQYDNALQINRTPTDASQYPVVLVSYHIGCVKQADAGKAELLKAFLGYVISSDGQQAAAQQAGSAPITDQLRQTAQTAVDAISAK
jgi:phosphate transport system substrate-binding protein